jgi:hypothetical protein
MGVVEAFIAYALVHGEVEIFSGWLDFRVGIGGRWWLGRRFGLVGGMK